MSKNTQPAILWIPTGTGKTLACTGDTAAMLRDWNLEPNKPKAMRPTESLSQYQQLVGRIFRPGTVEYASAERAFYMAEHAAAAGHPVKLGKNPGQPWSVTIEPKPTTESSGQ